MSEKSVEKARTSKVSSSSPAKSAAPTRLVVEASVDDFTKILNNPNLTKKQKVDLILKAKGLKTPRKRYASVEERKKAAAQRAKERRKKQLEDLPPELRPKPRVKLTKAQKKEKRRAHNASNRAALRELAKANPDLARRFGINPDRFRIK